MVCSFRSPLSKQAPSSLDIILSKEATMRLPLEHFQPLSDVRLDFKQDPRPDKGACLTHSEMTNWEVQKAASIGQPLPL